MTSFCPDTALSTPVSDADIQRAREFAVLKHGAQTYGTQTYVDGHIERVVALVRFYELPRVFILAAYLHDTLEDTNTSKEELTEHFGPVVAEMVDCVSAYEGSRRDRMSCMLEKLRNSQWVVPLKLMDRLGNVEATLEEGQLQFLSMYRKEMPAYAALFRAAHEGAFARLCKALDW